MAFRTSSSPATVLTAVHRFHYPIIELVRTRRVKFSLGLLNDGFSSSWRYTASYVKRITEICFRALSLQLFQERKTTKILSLYSYPGPHTNNDMFEVALVASVPRLESSLFSVSFYDWFLLTGAITGRWSLQRCYLCWALFIFRSAVKCHSFEPSRCFI